MARIRARSPSSSGPVRTSPALLLVSEGDSVLGLSRRRADPRRAAQRQLVLFVSVDRMADEVEAEVRTFDAERTEFVAGLRGRDAHPAGDGLDG